MNKVICCSGQARQGKTVVALYLALKLNWEKVSFATEVKNIYKNTFNVDDEFIEKWKTVKEPPPGFDKNVRQSLQFIGDGFRSIQQNLWVNILFKNNNPKCIDDGRYFGESKITKEKGGYNVLLWRPGHENDDPNPSESQLRPLVDWCIKTKQNGIIRVRDDNSPENIKNYDYFLINDGSLEELYNKIDLELIPEIKRYFEC